jgi:hypothetical protein
VAFSAFVRAAVLWSCGVFLRLLSVGEQLMRWPEFSLTLVVRFSLVVGNGSSCYVSMVFEGLLRRPELAESRHLVEQAVHRLDRERYAPLLPNVILGISEGGFGGGPDSTVADFRGRFDLDAVAYWELRNFGTGETAAREAARSRLEQSKLLQVQRMDRVAREIMEAHAQTESLHGQIAVAESGIGVANESYQRNLERIRGGQGLPLEVLQSIQALDQSRREYLRASGDYDEWQFRLYRSIRRAIPGEARTVKYPSRPPFVYLGHQAICPYQFYSGSAGIKNVFSGPVVRIYTQ